MKRYAVLLGFLLLLSACEGNTTTRALPRGGSKEESAASVSAAPFALRLTSESTAVALNVGEQVTVEMENPDGAALSAVSSDEAAAFVSVRGSAVTITGLAAGEAAVTVTGEKEGFESASLSIEVTVALNQNMLTPSASAIFLPVGENRTVRIDSQAAGKLTWEYDASALSLYTKDMAATVTAKKTGTYSLTATCRADGFADASVTIPVEVTARPLTLTYPTSASVGVDGVVTLSFSADAEDASLTVSCTEGISARADGMRVIVTGVSAGNAELTVTAAAPGCEAVRVSIPVRVSATAPDLGTTDFTDVAREIVARTNAEREAAGLEPLAEAPQLDAPAEIRSEEASRFWSHTRPDGRSCETVLADYGITYYSAGENLFSANVLDARLAVESWMKSDAHRENLLRAEFTMLGVGISEGEDGSFYYAQIFLKK